VHRRPHDGTYDSITAVDIAGTLTVEAMPGVTISAAQIFV
jgi:hypothetical protein